MDLNEELKKAKDVKPGEIKIYDVDSLISTDFPEPPAILANGIFDERGGVVIAGAPKTGKTFLAMQLAMCAATGTPFFDIPCAKPDRAFRTLYLNAEVTPYRFAEDRIKPNVKYFTGPAALTHVHVAFPFSTLRLDTKDGIATLGKMIDKVEPDILVIDPIVNFHSGDENSVQDMAKITALAGAVQNNGSAVILCHHYRKGNNRGARISEYMRGSTVLGGWYNTAIGMSWKRKPYSRYLNFDLRDGEPPEEKIIALNEDYKIFEEIFTESETGAAVEEYLLEAGTNGVSATDLKRKFKHNPEFPTKLTSLLKSGTIQELTTKNDQPGRPKKTYVHASFI